VTKPSLPRPARPRPAPAGLSPQHSGAPNRRKVSKSATPSPATFTFDPDAIVELACQKPAAPFPGKLPRLAVATVMGFVATGTPPVLALVLDGIVARTVLVDIQPSRPKIIGYLPSGVIRAMLGKGWLERHDIFFRVTSHAETAAGAYAGAYIRPVTNSFGIGGPILLPPFAEYPPVAMPPDPRFDRVPGQPWISTACPP
jgi:hypothetical protein